MNAVITGGTKGMGLAIAEIFAANGFELAIAARTQADLDVLEQDFARRFPFVYGPFVLIYRSVLAFAEAIAKRWPVVDVLVNNAGLFQPGKLLEDPDGFLENMLNVNFGALTTSRGPSRLRWWMLGKGMFLIFVRWPVSEFIPIPALIPSPSLRCWDLQSPCGWNCAKAV